MTVDIVLPLYKAKDEVYESINSVLNQTYYDWRLYIIDDASNDDKIKEIRSKYFDDRIIYIELEENKKAAGARNYAVKQGKGEFIAFIDQDDMWLSQKLEKQIKLFKDNVLIGASHSDIKILYQNNNGLLIEELDENKRRQGIDWEDTSTKDMADIVLTQYPMRVVTTVIRRSLYESIGGFDEKLFGCEEIDLWLKIAEKSKIGYIPEKLAIRRIHDNNVSEKYKLDRYLGHLNWLISLSDVDHYSYLREQISSEKKMLYFRAYGISLKEKKYLMAIKIAFKIISNYPIDLKSYLRLLYSFFLNTIKSKH